MRNFTGFVRINDDSWDDIKEQYKVIEYYRRNHGTSSAVEMTLETSSGEIIKKVFPFHWIEWMEGDR